MVPLVEASTMRLHPAARAAAHSRRVPSTCTSYMRAPSSGLRETKPGQVVDAGPTPSTARATAAGSVTDPVTTSTPSAASASDRDCENTRTSAGVPARASSCAPGARPGIRWRR